uniref:MADS-box domain-containing protein n=1 Tax=Cannabis sativa TaxID=3483 RepID=A0A803NPI9_CANSA
MEMNNSNENIVNNDNRNTQSRRINRGRRRVSMTRMTNESNLQVTFSKRRSGLFKKASELCTLCGVQIAIIVFSPGNKVYSFGHSSVNVVIDRYMNPEHYAMLMASQANSGTFQLIEAHRNATLRELNQQLTHITEQMESLKKRAKELKGIPCNFRDALNLLDGPVRNNVHEMSQLGNLKNAMEMLRNVTTEQSAVNTNMNMMNTLSSFYGAGDGEGSAIMNFGVGHDNVNHVNMGHNNMQGMMMTTPGGGSTLPAAMASLPLRSPLELPLQLQQPNPHQQYQGNSSTYGDHLFNNNPNNDDTNAGYDHPFF